jgi:hypothetical protein
MPAFRDGASRTRAGDLPGCDPDAALSAGDGNPPQILQRLQALSGVASPNPARRAAARIGAARHKSGTTAVTRRRYPPGHRRARPSRSTSRHPDSSPARRLAPRRAPARRRTRRRRCRRARVRHPSDYSGGMSRQALGNAAAGVLFLVIAIVDFTRDDSGVGVVFVIFAAVFLGLAFSGRSK